MELPVFFQAEQAALAALLGVLLAALYDLLRALRRVLPGAAGFADGLFALVSVSYTHLTLPTNREV